MTTETPSQQQELAALEVAVARVRLAHADELERQADVVLRAGAAARSVFSERAQEVRARAELLLASGVPPPLRHLCGIWDFEVPLNRMLGWLLDPAKPHGGGAAPLLQLVSALDHRAMVSDLRNGKPAKVFVEGSPDPDRWWRQPDLVVQTPGAVLLIENKVLAPESGTDQYKDYLAMATELAEGHPWCTVLLAREHRDTPDGWTRSMRHNELSEILMPLCQSSSLPVWTRILVALIVTDLRYDDLTSRIDPIRQILGRASSRDLEPFDVRRLSRLMEDLPNEPPWEPK